MNTESTVPRRTTVGVPRESAAGERRVALVPKAVEKLRTRGVDVVVEAGAGLGALIPDELFTQAGATIGDPWPCDVVAKVNPPTAEEIGRLSEGSTLIGFLAPLTSPEFIRAAPSLYAVTAGSAFAPWSWTSVVAVVPLPLSSSKSRLTVSPSVILIVSS